MRRLGPILALAVVALAGCALKKPPERAEVAKQALPNVTVPPAWTAQAGSAATPGTIGDGWLAGFKDPQLDALVQ